MTDPTIPELVARLRELHAKLQALQVGTPEFTAARQLFRDVLQLSEPAILDALDHIGDANKMAPHSPWLPIEECGALEDGWYDVWVVKPEYDGGAGQLMHARRFPSGEFVVAGLIYEAQHITHVHRMGPIRGPGEG